MELTTWDSVIIAVSFGTFLMMLVWVPRFLRNNQKIKDLLDKPVTKECRFSTRHCFLSRRLSSALFLFLGHLPIIVEKKDRSGPCDWDSTLYVLQQNTPASELEKEVKKTLGLREKCSITFYVNNGEELEIINTDCLDELHAIDSEFDGFLYLQYSADTNSTEAPAVATDTTVASTNAIGPTNELGDLVSSPEIAVHVSGSVESDETGSEKESPKVNNSAVVTADNKNATKESTDINNSTETTPVKAGSNKVSSKVNASAALISVKNDFTKSSTNIIGSTKTPPGKAGFHKAPSKLNGSPKSPPGNNSSIKASTNIIDSTKTPSGEMNFKKASSVANGSGAVTPPGNKSSKKPIKGDKTIAK